VIANGSPWIVVGQGLAGTCLAWSLWWRGVEFMLIDSGTGGSSRVAAGLINPITGKNFEPSWRIAEFLPDALQFYAAVEREIGRQVWYPFPVLRLASSEKEWKKITSKLGSPHLTPWVTGGVPVASEWIGAVEVCGGGRLDTRAFLDGSREFFKSRGCFQIGEVSPSDFKPNEIRCEGAKGLLSGRYGPHRCAKGEILGVQASGWDESRIRVGAGGWLVPQGGGVFKVGSTYEWDELDELPTAAGRLRIEEIAARLGGGEGFQVIDHTAGIRPILRRSQPLTGPMPEGGWMFNALGSKGSLYAPGMSRRLAEWLIDGLEPEPEVDIRAFSNGSL
jgi:glycine oxidase